MRSKQIRFKQNLNRENLIQDGKPLFGTLKGKWGSDYFNNSHPIVLEVGAGRGEYSVGLAKLHPEKNFIAIDIKGDRLWKGSSIAIEERLTNVAFLRVIAQNLEEHFAQSEVSEIWVPFAVPFPKGKKAKQRLTSQRFLDIYKHLLVPGGRVHVKTDSDLLYNFTLEELSTRNDVEDLKATPDMYASKLLETLPEIQTRFEQKALQRGDTIKYLSFSFTKQKEP